MTFPARGANRLKHGELSGDELERIRAASPSLIPELEAWVNYKAILRFGVTADGPAVAKVLRSSSDPIAARFAAEVGA